MLHRNKPIKVGWVEDTFAEDIKDNLLYGDKYELICSELANGCELIAEITYDGDDQLLSISYRKDDHANITVTMKWFPEDDELLETIHKVYKTGKELIK